MKNLLSLVSLMAVLISMNTKAITKSVDVLDHTLRVRDFDSISLKKLLRRSTFDRRQIAGWQLESVSLDAKSSDGQADVTLEVGHRETLPSTIAGNPDEFRTSGNFHSIFLSSPSFADRRGKWNLHFRGKVLVSDIDLKLSKSLAYDYTNTSGLHFISHGSFKADKLVGDSKTISVHGRLKGVKLKVHKQKARIHGIKIHFADGEVIHVDEINGKMKKGREKGFRLAGVLSKPVSKITVSATTAKLFGSRAKVEVLLAK